jgi:hypothetical protein
VDGVGSLLGGAMRLDPAAFEAILARPDGLRTATIVLVAAGLSQALGQSVALFANRVQPWRFVLSLLLGALLFAASVLVWGVTLDVAGRLGFGRDAPLREVVDVVGLAHAPRLLGILVLTPYFGTAIGAGLTIWTLLALTVGARAAFGVGLVEALAMLGSAWLTVEALSRTVGVPVVRLVQTIRHWVAGSAANDDGRPRPSEGHESR